MNRTLTSAFAATACIVALASPAQAQTRQYNIPAGSLKAALDAYVDQSGRQIVYRADEVREARSMGIRGAATADAALAAILARSGFTTRVDGSLIAIVQVPKAAQIASGTVPEESGRDPATSSPEIVVTGTIIRGEVPVGSALITYSRDDIDRSGFATLGEFIQTLPQNSRQGANGSALFNAAQGGKPGSAAAAEDFGQGVNLRGLGNGATLVLVNGTRLPPSSGGQYVDISMIPVSAIERVELLTGGASATYGSDAVAGVMNVILRTDYKGGETRLRYGGAEGGAEEIQLAQSLGTGWDSGGLMVSYEFFDKKPLLASDRPSLINFPTAGSSRGADPQIIPSNKRHSAFASITQEVGSAAALSARVFFGDRSFDRLDGGAGTLFGLSRTQGGSQQISGSLGVNYNINSQWQLAVDGTWSQSKMDYLTSFTNGIVTRPAVDVNGTDNLVTIDARVDGPLFAITGGDVKLAVGAQYRDEGFERITNNPNDPSRDLARDVKSLFGEIFIPLVGKSNARAGLRRLALSIASRYEDYSDFGSAFTPKFGVEWEPTKNFILRGSYSESFRAPTLNQRFTGQNLAFISDAGFGPGLNPPTLAGTNSVSVFGNDPNVGPEKSESWTMGFDWTPNDFTLSLTYFDIQYENRIAAGLGPTGFDYVDAAERFSDRFVNLNPTAGEVAAATGQPTVLNFAFDPNAPIGVILDYRLTNTAASRNTGIDLNSEYRFGLVGGQASATFNLVYTINDEFRSIPTSRNNQFVDTIFETPDLVMNGRFTWSGKHVSGFGGFYYTDSYVNDLVTPNQKVSSWFTVDAGLTYQTGENSSSSALDNLKLSLTVSNLFNELPPFVRAPTLNPNTLSFRFDGANANPLGRFVALALTKAW